jgi:hypothetical protein
MPAQKTLHEREVELQAVIGKPSGRDELEAMAAKYQASGGKSRPPRTSVITYILVHERSKGLIGG